MVIPYTLHIWDISYTYTHKLWYDHAHMIQNTHMVQNIFKFQYIVSYISNYVIRKDCVLHNSILLHVDLFASCKFQSSNSYVCI